MEHLELLVGAAAIIFSIYYIAGILEFWRNRRAAGQLSNSERSNDCSPGKPCFANAPSIWKDWKSKDDFCNLAKCVEQLAGDSSPEPSDDKFAKDVLKTKCACELQKSFSTEESQFHETGRKILESVRNKALVFKLAESAAWLDRLIEPMTRDSDKFDLFVNSMLEAIEHRSRNNIKKDDVVTSLAKIVADPDKLANIGMSDALVTANAFAFFASGFEATSDRTTVNRALTEMSVGQLFRKFREEMLRNSQGFAFAQQWNSGESEIQEDKEGEDELAVQEYNEPADVVPSFCDGAMSKIHAISNIRRYIVTKMFLYLSDPTISTARKTFIVSTGFLMIFSVFRFFPQIKREMGNVCRVMHPKTS